MRQKYNGWEKVGFKLKKNHNGQLILWTKLIETWVMTPSVRENDTL